MHNNRGNGYSRHDSQPGSSRSYDSWHDDSDWSRRNDSWRGSSSRSPRRSPNDHYRHRNDSWKEDAYRSRRDPRDDNFRLGRDRAPMPVDDRFLDRYGAKRLQNGNLVDRDGYTLRVRDLDCRAPSPPTYNPGREARIADIRNGTVRRNDLNRMSEADLDRKARQQMELMNQNQQMAPEGKSGENEKKNLQKSPQKPLEKPKIHSEDVTRIQMTTEMKHKIPEDVEGEDEYEEEDDAPPPQKKPAMIKTEKTEKNDNGISTYANNVKKALLAAPVFAKKTLLPGGPPGGVGGAPPAVGIIAGSPNDSKQKSWFRQYQEHVDALKEKAYGPPTFGPGAAPPQPSSTFFFQSPPPTVPPSAAFEPSGAFGGARRGTTPSSSTSSPYYSGVPIPGRPTSSGLNSGASNPYEAAYGIPPLQMALPPPGVVGFEPKRDSGAFGAFGTSSGASGAGPRDSGAFGAFGTSSGASGAYGAVLRDSGAPWTSFGDSGATSSYSAVFGAPGASRGSSGAHGAFLKDSGATGPPGASSAYSGAFLKDSGAPGAPGHHQLQYSSDSEEEDEAILKLREIIRNCGSNRN